MNALAFSNSEDITVDVVIESTSSKINWIRIDSDKSNLTEIEASPSMGLIDMPKIDFLWYRRPFESYSVLNDENSVIFRQESEEILWNYLLQYPRDLWINYPMNNWYSERKLFQLQHAPKFGLNVPDWVITSKLSTIQDFLEKHNNECLVKPINNGYIIHSEGLSQIYSTRITDEINLNVCNNCPTLFQSIVKKKFDVRTIYVDGEVLYIQMESDHLDVRENLMNGVKYTRIDAPANIDYSYRKFINEQGLRFCTSDFVVSEDNQWLFLENNPNGNWVWIEEFIPGIIDFFANSIRSNNDRYS